MNAMWKMRLAGLGALAVSGGALGYVSMGDLGENLVYYWSPAELMAAANAQDATVRLGGLVEPGSIRPWDPENKLLAFRVTDGTGASVEVECTGAPPQMFREGIGVVVEGELHADGVFRTDRVLVKHGNEYRAPEDGEQHPDVKSMYQSLEEGT